MKLIKLIKDLIKDDKNPRVWERLFVIFILLSKYLLRRWL
jgi:hypothetical protein